MLWQQANPTIAATKVRSCYGDVFIWGCERSGEATHQVPLTYRRDRVSERDRTSQTPISSLRTVLPEVARRYRQEGLWRDLTLADVLLPHLRGSTVGFKVWSETRPEETTVGEVFDRSSRFACWLGRQGIGPGDAVAFQLPNWAEAAIVFWGTILAGATVVPIVHTYGARELRYILEDTHPRVLVVAGRVGRHDLYSSALAAQSETGAVEHLLAVGDVRSGADLLDAALDGPFLETMPQVSPDSPAVIAYTSGTTAQVKGVVHTHQTLVAELVQLGMLPQPDPRPVLVGSPVGHVAGMTAALCDAVVRDKPIHMTDKWNAEDALSILREGDLCLRGGASYFLESILDAPSFSSADVDRMRYVRLGGSSISSELRNRAKQLGIVVMRMYGSTEHPSVSSCRDGDVDSAVETDGFPLPGVELSIPR